MKGKQKKGKIRKHKKKRKSIKEKKIQKRRIYSPIFYIFQNCRFVSKSRKGEEKRKKNEPLSSIFFNDMLFQPDLQFTSLFEFVQLIRQNLKMIRFQINSKIQKMIFKVERKVSL